MSKKYEIALRTAEDGKAALAQIALVVTEASACAGQDQLFGHANASMARGLVSYIAAGIYLLEARESATRGEWESLVREKWNHDPQWARRCMRIARDFVGLASDRERLAFLQQSFRKARGDGPQRSRGTAADEAERTSAEPRVIDVKAKVRDGGLADAPAAPAPAAKPAKSSMLPAPPPRTCVICKGPPPVAGTTCDACLAESEDDPDRFRLEDYFAPSYACPGCAPNRKVRSSPSAYMLECHWVDWPAHRAEALRLVADGKVPRPAAPPVVPLPGAQGLAVHTASGVVAAAAKFLPAPAPAPASAAPALPPARRIEAELARENPACYVCTHVRDEHLPSGECDVEDCECIAFESADEDDEPERPLTQEEEDAEYERAMFEQFRSDLANDPTEAHTIDSLLMDGRSARRGEPGTETTHEQHVLVMLNKAHEHAAYKLERHHYTPEAQALMKGAVEKIADALELVRKAVRKGWPAHQAKRAAAQAKAGAR